ncbi:glycosyltransferase [Chlorogloea sp. CCALA 695]|uniref:glycosyltransferase n=1 Tax=Chlorogloea sp. CCALA 695 TaxID=2107693 RepID=UPI000D07F2D8|nr:glycosyltransferase [Chlorogloea sp. CCALA 695]PSB32743.1 glycosyl transferase family 2 [Chlorogloea sp. CCALA 695]
MDTISYVIPTLNSGKTLDMTLLSLRSQKDVNISIIVVDSGSTDNTLDICERWNVKVLYAEPGNMYRAINIGLHECDTEWLAYINSDDWLYPNSLAQVIACGHTAKADIVYSNCDFTDVCGRFIYSFAPAYPKQLRSLFQSVILGFSQQSTIFRKQVYQQLMGFNENYWLSADYDFYFRALNYGAVFTFFDAEPVACFRIHSTQLSNTKAKEMQAEVQKILTEIGDFPSSYDWFVVLQWRIKNIPHYIIRLLRQSLIAGKLKINSSLKT